MDHRRQPTHRTVAPAAIAWEGARPVSLAFADIYHDVDGLGEVHRVFLAPARLPERFAAPDTPVFTIGELGFGSGLNFVATAKRFLEVATGSQSLHYISVDHAPMQARDIQRAASNWKIDLYAQLAERYPPLISGWHRRAFASGRIRLSLFFGDAKRCLNELCEGPGIGVDAWFLDGFAPSKNPRMWDHELYVHMADLSNPYATVTTFSAAGIVKRGLAAAGFQITRIDQRPHKRHSLMARLNRPQHAVKSKLSKPPSEVDVVGAGLAGCATARALADRGVKVRLFDAADRVASGASGIPAGLLHGRLLSDGSAHASLRAHAYAYSQDRVAGQPGATTTGALQLPGPNASPGKLQSLVGVFSEGWVVPLDAMAASVCAGAAVDTDGLHFPRSLLVDGRALCAALIEHDRIDLRLGIERHTTERGMVTVLACASATQQFDGCDYLEITDLFGQIDLFTIERPPNLPILADGYVAPARRSCFVGSTYEYREWQPADATAANLARFAKRFPDTGTASDGVWRARFRSARAVTSDRTPIIGALPGLDAVHVNIGHGSNGLTTAPFAAEWIASSICGECLGVTKAVQALCAPDRFITRQMRRDNPFSSGSPSKR